MTDAELDAIEERLRVYQFPCLKEEWDLLNAVRELKTALRKLKVKPPTKPVKRDPYNQHC